MNAIHQCLDSLDGAKLATVVHVNATDPGLIDRYLALGARRVVLTVADADAVAPMRRAAGGRAGVEVVEAIVSSKAGAASWLRFNVREVSGLLEPSGLRTFYPRLQLIE